jgi:hypothetical protein
VPDQDAWFGLLELPSVTLFVFVVVPAQRGEVTFAGEAALVPGDGVVQVTAGGGSAAARGGAPGAAGADQVLEFAAGPVPGLGLGVVAVAAGDRDQAAAQAAQVVLRRGVGAESGTAGDVLRTLYHVTFGSTTRDGYMFDSKIHKEVI